MNLSGYQELIFWLFGVTEKIINHIDEHEMSDELACFISLISTD